MPLILPNTIANLTPADGDKLDQNFDTVADYVNQNTVIKDGSVGMTGALLLPGKPTQANQAATKSYVDDLIPVGVMYEYAGDVSPSTSWMLCRGQAISRATYSALFGVIGVRFGGGDGNSTFNLPDMRGRLICGHNEGGSYLQNGVGTRWGSKDAITVAHAHGVVDHAHHLNINSGGVTQSHYHPPHAPYSSFVAYRGTGGSNGLAAGATVGFDASTDWMSNDHAHGVVGNTDASSTWTINTNGAVDGTNMNIPPVVTFNFIMKVV